MLTNNGRSLLGYDVNNEHNLGVTGVDVPLQVLHNNIGLNNTTRLTLNVQNTGPQGEASGPYGHDMGLPRLPVVHPYHPLGENRNNERYNSGIPSFLITVSIPQGTIGNLPSGVKERLIQYGININNLNVFFCAQTKPWQNQTLLLRPHPWLHFDAPRVGGYNHASNILASVTDIGGRFEQLVPINGVHTHPNERGEMVYSATQMPIQGVSRDATDAFYSFCIDIQTGQAALTLHWLLNQQDEVLINAIINKPNITLKNLILEVASLDNSQISGTLANQPHLDFTPAQALNSLVFGRQIHPENNQNISQFYLGEETLLEKGVNVETSTIINSHPQNNILLENAFQGNLEGVRIALEQGASINALENSRNCNALQLAILCNHPDVVGYLLPQKELNFRHKTTDEKTAVQLALEHGRADFIRRISDMAPNATLLGSAAKGDITRLQQALRFADINSVEAQVQYNALQLAIAYNRGRDVIGSLIRAGINIGYKATNGKTAIALALDSGNKELAHYLSGIRINSDLLTAAALGNVQGIRAAIKSGADMNAIEINGFNCLQLALLYAHNHTPLMTSEITTLLLNNGINLDYRSPRGTALELARGTNKIDIVSQISNETQKRARLN